MDKLPNNCRFIFVWRFYIKQEFEDQLFNINILEDIKYGLSKMNEKAAKNTNTACFAAWVMHQPKMPASLIKKD